MPPIAHAELLALVPDFAVLSFDTALRRDAFAGRDARGQLVIALADPADTDLVDGLGAAWPRPSACARPCVTMWPPAWPGTSRPIGWWPMCWAAPRRRRGR
jgi:hypothetical protein